MKHRESADSAVFVRKSRESVDFQIGLYENSVKGTKIGEKYVKATISDVSKIANVSMSTVSHVINGTRRVSEETARRVNEAIEKTGYIPNFVAKSLKQSSTRTIGLVVTDIRNQFFVDVIHAIDEEARKEGYQVFISETEENLEREFEIIKLLVERRVDGIIYSPTAGSEKQTVDYLKKVHIPVVMIDRVVGRDFDWVGVENLESAKELVRYLNGLGHRRIGILAGFRGINTTEDRITGFKEAMKESGCEIRKDWIVSGNYRNEPVTEKVIKMMKQESAPTALIAANDRMIFNAMEALKTLGMSVPGDVAMVAFGNFEWSDFFEPRLTTLEQPCREIGKQAYWMLKRRLQEEELPVQQIKLMPRFEIRESCGEKLAMSPK